MFRKFMFALLISVFLLGSTAFAQDEKEEKKLDFEDIQSTPEKVLEHFFAFFKEADIENLKKICDSGLHEELEQFAEMKEMMKGVRFEFKPLEFITKDDFCLAVAEVCIIDENRGKFEVDIAAISLRKTDDKWLILKLDDTVEDAPEWAQEAYKSIMKEKKFFTKFREAQASPYFVAYEYIGALAEKDLETLKILTPSDDKSQEMVVKFAEIVEEGMKFKTLVKNVVEKEDYAVCMLEISVVGEETEDFVFLMKNEGYKELPSWKIMPIMESKTILEDKNLNLPEWVTEQVKWCLDKKDEIKNMEKMFAYHLYKLRDYMLAGDYKKIMEYFDESEHEMLEEMRDAVKEITKLEYLVFHVKGDEAISFGEIELIETGDEDTESDEWLLGAKLKDGKWIFTLEPDEDEMVWIEDVWEIWEVMGEVKDKVNYRPSSKFKEKDPDYGYNYGDKKESTPEEKPKTDAFELGKPLTGKVEGYRVSDVKVMLEKAGIYRFEAKSITEGGEVYFYLKHGNLNIGNVTQLKGKVVLEIYLTPGEYTVQISKGYNAEKEIEVVEFSLIVFLLDSENLPESLPKVELDKEYVLEDLSSKNAREYFMVNAEAGYYKFNFLDGDAESKGGEKSVSLSIFRLPSRWYSQNFNLPNSKVIYLPKGLNKIVLTTWQKNPLPVKFTLSKIETIKSGDVKTVNIPKNAEMGWQFKLDIVTKVNFALSGESAGNIYFRIMQANGDTDIDATWGKNRVMQDFLDPGIYMIKLTGEYSKDAENITLKANFEAIGFPKIMPTYKGETIVLKKSEVGKKEIEMDLTGYQSSKFVCIKVIDNATGLIIPEASIKIGREKLDGTSGREYTRMRSIGENWGNSFNGKGCMFGYLLPLKHSLRIGVHDDVEEVKIEITLDDDVSTLETGKFLTLNMKKNEVVLYKVNVDNAKSMILDAIFLSAFGYVEAEIWCNGFEQKGFTGWGLENGFTSKGLFTKGTYYIVLKRTPRKKWMPNPEIDELPLILNMMVNIHGN